MQHHHQLGAALVCAAVGVAAILRLKPHAAGIPTAPKATACEEPRDVARLGLEASSRSGPDNSSFPQALGSARLAIVVDAAAGRARATLFHALIASGVSCVDSAPWLAPLIAAADSEASERSEAGTPGPLCSHRLLEAVAAAMAQALRVNPPRVSPSGVTGSPPVVVLFVSSTSFRKLGRELIAALPLARVVFACVAAHPQQRAFLGVIFVLIRARIFECCRYSGAADVLMACSCAAPRAPCDSLDEVADTASVPGHEATCLETTGHASSMRRDGSSPFGRGFGKLLDALPQGRRAAVDAWLGAVDTFLVLKDEHDGDDDAARQTVHTMWRSCGRSGRPCSDGCRDRSDSVVLHAVNSLSVHLRRLAPRLPVGSQHGASTPRLATRQSTLRQRRRRRRRAAVTGSRPLCCDCRFSGGATQRFVC